MNILKNMIFLVGLVASVASAASVQDEMAVLQDQLMEAVASTHPDSVEKFTKITSALALREEFIRQAGDRYILVNKADYTLRAVKGGKEMLFDKVVIGRPEQPTPELAAKVTTIVTNPDWTVSNNTAVLVTAPRFLKDPNYASAMGYVIYSSWGPNAKRLDAKNVDWAKYISNGSVPLKIYQKPGKFNSLGNIKFVVPGTDGIFLHGSPYKSLFDKEKREFSSGCIRLQKTLELADLILDDVSGTVLQTRMKNGRTKNYHVKNPMKFFVVNWPVTVDAVAKKVVYK